MWVRPSSRSAATGVLAGQRGGGCEIRTREGLHPTRFPTLLAGVHHRPPPFMACADPCWAATGERRRTGVNEPRTEPMPAPRRLAGQPVARQGVPHLYLWAHMAGSGWSGQRTWRRVCARRWTRSCPCWRSGKTATAGIEPAVWPASVTGETQIFSRRLHNVIRAIPWTRGTLNTRVIRVAPVFLRHTLGWC